MHAQDKKADMDTGEKSVTNAHLSNFLCSCHRTADVITARIQTLQDADYHDISDADGMTKEDWKDVLKGPLMNRETQSEKGYTYTTHTHTTAHL
jgi:hypothetical protein